MAPVPPLPTATFPFTLAALPAISPVTFEPAIPEILASVIAKLAMSSVPDRPTILFHFAVSTAVIPLAMLVLKEGSVSVKLLNFLFQ